MGRQKIEQRNERKLQKATNGSYRVTLPIEVIRNLKWRDGQKVVIDESRGQIVIKDWKGK